MSETDCTRRRQAVQAVETDVDDNHIRTQLLDPLEQDRTVADDSNHVEELPDRPQESNGDIRVVFGQYQGRFDSRYGHTSRSPLLTKEKMITRNGVPPRRNATVRADYTAHRPYQSDSSQPSRKDNLAKTCKRGLYKIRHLCKTGISASIIS